MSNRLKLDWALSTNEERAQFLHTYLQQQQFLDKPPTDEELSTMGDYILWGKNHKGENGRQQGIELTTRYGTWDDPNASKYESLDALIEQPTFNEASVYSLGQAPLLSHKREVFSRDEALAKCPSSMVDEFRRLFRSIDELDLSINLYDIAHGRRTTPPREKLIRKFTDEEIALLNERISHWNQYQYLKKRHLLVELRQEQYLLRDSYQPTNMAHDSGYDATCYINDPIDWDAGINVYPLGIFDNSQTAALIFQDTLNPLNLGEEELQLVSDRYWTYQDKMGKKGYQFDFRKEQDVYNILNESIELHDAIPSANFDSNLPALMRTLDYYVRQADLTDVQRDILHQKLNKIKNSDIAINVNKKWKKSYTPNYISTIFTQRIIPRIVEAAQQHEQIISNIFFPDEFKKCTCCGRMLMRDSVNFTKKTRSKDGFTSKCKKCEKAARQGKKED